MELNPLYRFYVELNDKVDRIINNGGVSSSAGSDLSDVIVRLRELEGRKNYDKPITELYNEISILKKENDELKHKLDNYAKYDTLEPRLYNLEVAPKIDVSPLESRLAVLENNNYTQELQNLENKINNMEHVVNMISDLTYRVTAIESKDK